MPKIHAYKPPMDGMMEDTLLVEIRCEELPPAQVRTLARGFGQRLHAALAAAGFADAAPPDLPAYATPRRFAALLPRIRAAAAAKTVLRRGPPVAACRDAGGAPTPALLGFMRSAGAASQDDLRRITDGGRDYMAYEQSAGGEALAESLPRLTQDTLLSLNAPRLMRWGDNDFKFIRPLRGALLMHGGAVLRGEILGITAGDGTVGHPALHPHPIKLRHAEEYEAALEKGQVLVDLHKRRAAAAAQLDKHQDGAGEALPELLDEVTALCEMPAAYQGALKKEFLQLPAFCVHGCLIKHQRVFPLTDEPQGALGAAAVAPKYCFIADNRPPNPQKMQAGWDAVLTARLRDVAFYLQEDAKLTLDASLQKLQAIVYHRKLGSQRARVERLQKIAGAIATRLSLSEDVTAQVQQAALLCKSDLPTLMIGEYPEFEGCIAAQYFCQDAPPLVHALVRAHAGTDWPTVAEEISAQDAAHLPPVAAFFLALQLEKLVGLFAADEKPSGSKDPHGLRAAGAMTAGILSDTRAGCERLSLYDLLADAAAVFDLPVCTDEVARFIGERKRQQLLDSGAPATVLNAVFCQPQMFLGAVAEKTAALSEFLQLPQAAMLCEAHKRVNNILRKSGAADGDGAVDESLLQDAAERALHAAMQTAAGDDNGAASEDYRQTLRATAALHDTVARFFDEVLVNTDDARLRANRLALLSRLRDVFNQVGDLSKLSGG